MGAASVAEDVGVRYWCERHAKRYPANARTQLAVRRNVVDICVTSHPCLTALPSGGLHCGNLCISATKHMEGCHANHH